MKAAKGREEVVKEMSYYRSSAPRARPNRSTTKKLIKQTKEKAVKLPEKVSPVRERITSLSVFNRLNRDEGRTYVPPLMENGKIVRGKRELMFGRSGSGKTSLLFKRMKRRFLEKGHPEDPNDYFFILYMPSYETNRAWEGYEDVKKLFEKPHGTHSTSFESELAFDNLTSVLREVVTKMKRMPFLILDDMGDNNMLKRRSSERNVVQDLAKQAAHFSVSIVSLFQRVTQSSPTMRENSDTTTIFPYESDAELRLIHKTYFGSMKFNNFKERFLQLLPNPFDNLTIVIGKGGERKIYLNDREEVQF